MSDNDDAIPEGLNWHQLAEFCDSIIKVLPTYGPEGGETTFTGTDIIHEFEYLASTLTASFPDCVSFRPEVIQMMTEHLVSLKTTFLLFSRVSFPPPLDDDDMLRLSNGLPNFLHELLCLESALLTQIPFPQLSLN